MIIQLLKRGVSYEHNGERIKFLADLTRNTDDERNEKFKKRHYNKDIDDKLVNKCRQFKEYRICSRNLRTLFPIFAAEKSGCVKYADFFCGGLDLGFILA